MKLSHYNQTGRAACMALLISSLHAMDPSNPPQDSARTQMVKSIIAGAGAGIAEVCILGQICSYLINQCIPRPGIPAKKLSLNRKLWTQPGFISLYPRHIYKGVGVNAGSMAPITAIQNMIADQGKKWLEDTNQGQLTDAQQLMPPVGAGAIAAFVATPSECLPNYMQQVATDGHRHLSTQIALQEIGTKYGMRYLWRGILATMIRDGLFTAGYKTVPYIVAKPVSLLIDNKPTAHMITLIAAGLVTAIATQPAHVIARYMQNNHTMRSSLHTGIDIVKHYGVRGLWSGGMPRGGRIMVAIPVLSEAERQIRQLLQ